MGSKFPVAKSIAVQFATSVNVWTENPWNARLMLFVQSTRDVGIGCGGSPIGFAVRT